LIDGDKMSVIPVRHYDIDKEFHKMLGINKRDKLLVKLKKWINRKF